MQRDVIIIMHSFRMFKYAAMLRIYKHYAIRLPEGLFPLPAVERMSFSSYPGSLSSGDDFYIMDKLVYSMLLSLCYSS